MATDKTTKSCYRATADIDFPKAEQFLESILASIATHDVRVTQEGAHHKIVSSFGNAHLAVHSGHMRVTVETKSRQALNRLKFALVGPISFIAASENLQIKWHGDEPGFTSLEDLRVVRVQSATRLTPLMHRIVFKGTDLVLFERDDQLHCRLIIQPKDVSTPQWPMIDDRGHIVWPNECKLDTRVYTIRKIDAARGEITIDFAIHHQAGPATQWAISAIPGDVVGLVGPAAGGCKSAQFYVFAGDETSLPGIARILESLNEEAHGCAFIEVAGPLEVQHLTKPANIDVAWLFREGAASGTTTLLPDAVRTIDWPPNLEDTFFWGGCEHKAFREIHRILRHEVKLPRDNQVLYSHWHQSLSEEQIIAIGGEAYLAE